MKDAIKPHEYGRAYRFLDKSGIADAVLKTKIRRGSAEISYRSIPSNNTRHANPIASGESNYFEFAYDPISVVIGLIDDSTLNGSVKLTDKTLIMSEKAIDSFRRGWKVMQVR